VRCGRQLHACPILFRRDSDSRFTWIHDFEEQLTKSVGPVPFSALFLICTSADDVSTSPSREVLIKMTPFFRSSRTLAM